MTKLQYGAVTESLSINYIKTYTHFYVYRYVLQSQTRACDNAVDLSAALRCTSSTISDRSVTLNIILTYVYP